jgi:D-hexose-6-phosphate mutarotase
MVGATFATVVTNMNSNIEFERGRELTFRINAKDDDGNPLNDKTAETYIKVSDMISIDITGLNTSVNLLEGRATQLETSTNKLETSTYRLEQRATNLEAYT